LSAAAFSVQVGFPLPTHVMYCVAVSLANEVVGEQAYRIVEAWYVFKPVYSVAILLALVARLICANSIKNPD
jgi:hypothetical protein